MTCRVIVQPNAIGEMRDAYRWIARDSPRIAARWFNGVERAIESLAVKPARCPLAPENEYFEEEIRELFFGRRGGIYRILFTIREDTVSVLHVRHGSRDTIRPDMAAGAEDEQQDA